MQIACFLIELSPAAAGAADVLPCQAAGCGKAAVGDFYDLGVVGGLPCHGYFTHAPFLLFVSPAM